MKARTYLAAALLALSGLAGIATVHGMQAQPAALPAVSSVDPATLTRWNNAFDIKFTDVTPGTGDVPAADAVAAAQAAYPEIVTPGGASQVAVAAIHLGTMSEDSYYKELPDGTRQYFIKDRRVWVVRFMHANLPYSMPKNVKAAPMRDGEADVIVDASTGTALNMVGTIYR